MNTLLQTFPPENDKTVVFIPILITIAVLIGLIYLFRKID